MAKIVKEGKLVIILSLTREGGVAPVKVECRADYEVTSDDLRVTRSFEPTLTDAQKTVVKNFGAAILAGIMALES